MIVKLLLFAEAKEIAGSEAVELTLSEGATVSQLKQAVVELHPAMAKLIEKSSISVDRKYAQDDQPLHDGAEIGLIPPVSGG